MTVKGSTRFIVIAAVTQEPPGLDPKSELVLREGRGVCAVSGLVCLFLEKVSYQIG